MAVGQRSTRSGNLDIGCLDVAASSASAASKSSDVWRVLGVSCAFEVLEGYIRDCKRTRVIVAQCQIRLAVALVDFDGVVGLNNNL